MIGLLVIDDEPMIADSLFMLLKKDAYINEHCQMHKAYNAIEAEFIIDNEDIDIILSDVNMPNTDGISLRNKLLDSGKKCSFIFISGYSDFNNIYKAMKIPGTRFLLKSEPDEVILTAVTEEINEYLKSNKEKEIIDLTQNIVDKGGYQRFIKKIDQYLSEHLDNEACLKSAADYMNISSQYLSKIYKQLTGQNFSDRLIQLKIERAKQLLQTSEEKIYEISRQVGYSSSSAFVYFFKKHTGMTPQQFRNRL